MQCLAFLSATPSLVTGEDSEQAGVAAAVKLMGNFARVVKDITNQGPKAIDGTEPVTQTHLTRVDPKDTKHVEKMVSAACCRLLGKEVSGASTPEEARVWMEAARFLQLRTQAPGDCLGRKADMSQSQAEAMKVVLAQIEAAHKLMSNRETVVKDITNPGPRGVKGGALTQTGLMRVDPKHQACVDAMVSELISLLLGKNFIQQPSSKEDMLVWIEAAAFFGERVQGTSEECDGRRADMSNLAAQALRTVTAQMEAAVKLMSNRERVVKDIANPGPTNIEGKELTQTDLKRVDVKHKAIVDDMVRAVGCCLLGQGVAGPVDPDEALVWLEAVTYLYGRIQETTIGSGRAPDLSSNGATMFKRVLGKFEAAAKLMSNRERVVLDIVNQGGPGVNGFVLTQRNVKRVAPIHQASVEAMISELGNRLLGRKTSAPSSPGAAQVWADAASFFSSRIQALNEESPGRKADMSPVAAKAMKKELASIANMSNTIDPASREAAQKLMSNYVRVVQDITNPGPQNIHGKELTQKDLKRVDIKHQALVDAMVRDICCGLVGKATPKPLAREEALVWAEAACFLSARIQGTPEEMAGRNPDMSSEAATALRTMLAQMEAAHMLMSNREKVVQDITNPGPTNIEGKALTQTDLKRVDVEHQASVNAMVKEVSLRLLGMTPSKPPAQEALAWSEAARFLSGRIQGTPNEMRGRKPDMSSAAAAALRKVLEQL